MTPTWRDIARPIIAQVIADLGTEDTAKLRKALRAAYPFGEREYHPYKIWCHEIRVQLGKIPFGRPARPARLRPTSNTLPLFGTEQPLPPTIGDP